MRMRRILAFVLAVVMLMGNTVTASATSASSTPISGNYNITTGENGETIISPIDVEDEDEISEEGQEVTPPADNGGEPNGGDTGTGDEGSGEGVGDDTGTPNGDDENNNDDLDSGEEGGDIDEPNGEDGEGEDPEAPAEGEEITTEEETMEEETTEEETTEEELAPGPLFDGEGDIEGDEIQNAGEYVEMAVNWEWDNARYFKSIANAIDWIDTYGDSDPQTQYALGMVNDTEGNVSEFAVSGDDLVSTTKAAIWLNLSADISVTSDARVNISFNGGTDENGKNYALNLAEGASLQILEGANNERIFWRDLDIKFSENNAGDFIVGEQGAMVAAGDSDATLVYFSDVAINNAEDAYFYAGFGNGYIYDSTNGTFYSGEEVSFADVVIDLPASNDGTMFYPCVDFAVPLTMDSLDLNGFMEVKDLTVKNSMSATGAGNLRAFGDVAIANLTTTAIKEPDYRVFSISLNESYNNEYKEENFIQKASLTLSGSLNGDERLYIYKAYVVFSDNGWFQESLDYEIGDVLVTVEKGEDEEANATLTDTNNYSVYIPDMACYLEEVKAEGENNLYNLTICEDYNQIRVYANTDEDSTTDWQKGFEDFASLKNYLSSNGIEGAQYYVHVNEEGLDVYENDLNFAGLNIGGISLELDGHSIDVVEDAIISVEHISGYVYDNGNRVNGITSDINLPNESTTLELIPSFTTEHGNNYIGGQGFRIISNNSVVKIGNPDDVWNSEAWFEADIVNELAELHTYGRVAWEGASQVVAREFHANNLSENQMWQEAYFKNVTVGNMFSENGNVGFDKVNVTDTLHIRGGQTFSVKKGGAATVNNIEVIATDDPYSSVTIELERQVKLAADDEYNWPDEMPSFVGATDVAKLGTIKITGDINVSCEGEQWMATPLFVRKLTGWEVPVEGEDWTNWYAMTEEFNAGETIATVTNTSVPADLFGVEGRYSFVQRSGTVMKVGMAVLSVVYESEEEWKEMRYTSFADAVKNMPKDFDEAEGRYIFNLLNDTKLTADVTIPSFVKELIFETECHGYYDEMLEDWVPDNSTRYQKFLDLNGKKLSTSAGIRMNGGVRICSSTSAAGKLVSTCNECALEISETFAFRDEEENEIYEVLRFVDEWGNDIDRAPALDNVAVTTTQGGIDLVCVDDRDNLLNASFDTRGFFVHQGRWIIDGSKNYVKTTDFRVDGREDGGENYFSVNQLTLTNGHGELYGGMDVGTLTLSGSGFDMYSWVEADAVSVTNGNCRVAENGSLITKDLTLNNSVYAEGWYTEVTNKLTMTNGSRLDVWCDMHAKEISASASKILVGPEGGGNLYADKITVASAYAGDAFGDYTLQNNGQILVRDTLSMTAGTLENAGLIEADTLTLKDFNNSCCWCPDEEGGHDQFGHILCNTITNTGKAYLGRESHLLINTSGTLNNVNVGDRYGDNGDALVGRSQDATVTFKGTFTRNDEEQKLLGFVTDEYVNKIGDNSPAEDENGNEYTEYYWDWINLGNDNGTPDNWEDDYDADHVVALEKNALLFKTEIASFPVDAIRVLPWTVAGDTERVDNSNNFVYQSGKELKIIGEYIHVSSINADGNGGTWLKSFTNWKDAVAYINTLNNASVKYVIDITADIDINGKLELPTKAAEIVIRSDNEIVLSYQGDITLNSNTAFENIMLEPYSVSSGKIVPYQSSIDTKGKLLDLINVEVVARENGEDGISVDYVPLYLKAIKGTASTQLNLQNGTLIMVKTKISGLNEIYIANGSAMTADGGISVNNLVFVNWPEWIESNQGRDGYLGVVVNGSSNVLEVKNRLNMFSPTEIYCGGSIKINNIYSNCSGNVLSTEKENQITISGRVLADNEYINEAWNKVSVVAERDNANNIVGYRYPTEEELNNWETSVAEKDRAEVMPYAIMVEAGTGVPDTVLATAAQVSPIWFIAPSNVEGCDFDMTRKVGSNIVSGSNTNNAVILSALFGEDEEGNRILKEMNRFGKLEDAFAEIDKIAAPTFTYVITLNDNVAMLNSSGKPADYTFPKQAAEVIITSNGDANTISYNKELKLQSNVAFENVVLSANTTGGNVALDKFTLRLSDVDFAEQNAEGKVIAYNITGSGVGKGSRLVVEDCDGQDNTLAVAKLSKVDIVGLVGANIAVGGDTEIGDLCAENGERFIGLGKITIANIYSSENPATIVTAPKLTLADKGKATEKVTKVEANMTVSGVIEGSINFELHGIDANLNDGKLTFEKAGLDSLATGAGLAFVKATNANTEMVTVFGSNEYIYKKAGVFTYKSVGPQVELSYDDTTSTFETFADAVTEINNLKTKRDYTIRFIETSASTPVTLTMPKAGMVDTLVLTAAEDVNVYYVKDIKFDSNVVLEDINFVQMVEVNKEYVDKSTAIYMPEVDKYFDPVKVTINGAYTFDVIGAVTFNTPIALTGAKKATFVVDGDGALFASVQNDTWEDATGVIIEGTIKDFAVLDVTADMLIEGYLAGKPSAATQTYKAAEINVTTFNIANEAQIYVGDSRQTVDSVTVTNLNMSGGDLTSWGNGIFKNVTLSDNPYIAVYGQKFNITGTLTSATENALLVTVLDAKKLTSVLNVSGSVVLQNPDSHAIWVDIVGPDEGFDLGGTYTDEDGKTQTYSNKLLTASKASLNAFLAWSACVGGRDLYDAEYNEDGYILKKSGSDFLVYYAEDVEVALYTLEEAPGEGDIAITSCDYYISFNEAVAAIDALKDTSADYMIELLNDVGTENAYEKVNLPTKAASLTIYSANGSAIYYNNDLTLGCNTLISEVDLKPQIANKKEKGIALKGYELVLDRIQTDKIGKITGNNKNDKLTVLANQNLTIAGDLTGVADFELLVENESSAEITVTGKLTVKNLIFETGAVNLTVQGKGSSVTDIRSISEDAAYNRLSFAEMTVNGAIETANSDSRVELNNTSVSTAAKYNGNKLDLVATSKLATISKAALTNVDFFAKGTPVTNAQWSAKSVYNVEANANAVTVSKEDGTLLVTCVDLAQASAYIDTLADKTADYVIGIDNAITDTVVTDTAAVGKITLPAKDKMASVVVDGADEVNPAIAFSGDIATNGVVTLKDIKLANTADFSISNKKNSDTKVDGEKVAGKGELTLDNVAVNTYVEKGVVKGNLKNISGEKNVTKLAIVNPAQGNLNAVGGITNISKMTLINTALTTAAKSEVSILKLASGGAWVGYGATVIGTVENEEQSDQSYLGTYLAKGVPQMTINGSVSKPVMMKLYDFATKKEIFEARPIADANKTQAELYQNQPLVVAKTEAADKFIAEPFATGEDGNWEFSNASVQARKDAKNYVYNGDISGMEVLLVASVDGADDTETYVATYVDAINIINNIGNKNADYTVKLRATGSNIVEGVDEIRTAGKDGVAAYGSLALPAANKAKSLTIKSEDAQVRLAYTGTMAPKCDLNFENVILTEGTTKTVDGKVVFTPSNFVTPALGTANITFGEDVCTLKPDDGDLAMSKITAKDMPIYGLEEDATYALVFSKVSANKGSELNVCGNAAYVIGDASVATLSVLESGVLSVGGKATITDVVMENGSAMNLNCKNAIKITNIKGDGDLEIKTAYTDKEWLKAVTQLTIDGEMEMPAGLTVMQYAVDGDMYQLLNTKQLEDVLMNPNNKPAAYQKLITAPKLQVSDAVNVITEAGRDYNLFKLDGAVYLTDKEPVIEVVGYEPYGMKYRGNFFTWEQAVKEIDKLNHGPSKTETGWNYTFILHNDIGADGNPIKTLTLPTKAAKVTIGSWTGDEGIMMTGTTVSLKTDLEIQVPIVAMKKTGNNYYDTVYTLNAGNYALELNYVLGAEFDNMGWHEPQFKLSGSSKSVVTVNPEYRPNGEGTTDVGMISQISGIGTVILEAPIAPIDRYGEVQNVYYNIPDGISNIGELVLKPAVTVGSNKKDVNVKKLTMGFELVPEDNGQGEIEYRYVLSDNITALEAKNITVSDTLTIARSYLKAGTSASGDGKVTLTNVVFVNNENTIEAKQDKNGKSQIQIKGTVSTAGEHIRTCDAAVAIGLYYNNSARNYAQLTEGMVLLTAPKVASSWFWPEYENMGGMPTVHRTGTDENGNPVEWYEPAFKPYKSGNDIKYGRTLAQDENGDFAGELIEARVWIGGRPGGTSFMEFMTFEEAVKAIDSTGLQKTVVDQVTGKATKEYETYYIEIVNDVNIGNDKGDGKYSALTLPAKAKEIILLSVEHKDIKFSGNLTLKCNTAFSGIDLIPMKAVKGGAEPTTTNIAIGNYVLSWDDSNCNEEWYEENGLLKCDTYINNITGGAKGELVITNGSLIKANNITGLNAIRFDGCGIEGSGQILTDGNITIKELHYENMADGILRVCGNLTTNVVYVTGENNAQIWKFADKTMKVNGVTLTQKDENGKTVKINESVIYSEEGTSKVLVDTISTSGTVLPGSKIINGKYLDVNDWNISAMRTPHSGYVTGNDLYLGTPLN